MKHFFELLAILVILFIGCGPKEKGKHVKAGEYVVTSPNSTEDTSDDLLYWYIINADNGGCYTHSSKSQITDFSGVRWTYSSTSPASTIGVPVQPIEIEQTELSPEISEQTTEAACDLCSPRLPQTHTRNLGKFPFNESTDQMTVTEIDSCEYIVFNSFSNHEPVITHKGNCKYCLERLNKLIYNGTRHNGIQEGR